jgi:hypothetical protein
LVMCFCVVSRYSWKRSLGSPGVCSVMSLLFVSVVE